MPIKPSMHALRALRSSRAIASPRLAVSRLSPAGRFYSTDAADTPPPLLSKLKGDLKTAMRAKDTSRLNVLRAIMSANLNASKTSSPIRTDVQLVALIRKIQKSAQDAAADAKAAGREDLVEKEEQQIKVLDEYAANSGVQTLGEAELKLLVQEAVEASKAAGVTAKAILGDVMKRLTGALEGKDVDRKELAKMVKKLIG
ncbi:Fc.00g091160.m01.CDS01 [Cosmosporella sp. VM-42]